MSTHLQPVQQLVPGGDLSAYIQAVGSIPVLSVERERELAAPISLCSEHQRFDFLSLLKAKTLKKRYLQRWNWSLSRLSSF